jgi:hypothetical protein
MVKKDSETSEAKRGAVEVPDGPLLDLTDAAVKRMIKLAKKRGFVTYAELNAVLPSEEVNSERIEDILSMLNEMGINVIENEERENASPEKSSEEGEKKPAPVVETVHTAAGIQLLKQVSGGLVEIEEARGAALWDKAVESLGRSAGVLEEMAELTGEAIARIAARGDRIDRVNAENHATLDDLQHGKW